MERLNRDSPHSYSESNKRPKYENKVKPDGMIPSFDTFKFAKQNVFSNRGRKEKIKLDKPSPVGKMSRLNDKSWRLGSDISFPDFEPPAQLPQDLSIGFDEFCNKFEEIGPESLELVLKTMKSICSSPNNSIKKPDVVTWRGALSKIMMTPYLFSRNDGWKLSAWKRKGVLYLQTRSHSSEQGFKNTPRKFQEFMYYGYKFESLSTSSDNEIPNPNECFNSVFKSRIGDKRLIYGAEIDCRNENGDFIELKVTALLESDKQKRTFERFKLLKFFCQSFLASTERIFVGFRKDSTLQKTQMFKTLSIPEMVKSSRLNSNPWDVNVCLKFLDEVLDFLVKQIPESASASEDKIYEIEFDPNAKKIFVIETTPRVYEQIDSALYSVFESK